MIICLVGPSGSGKSTVAQALVNFYKYKSDMDMDCGRFIIHQNKTLEIKGNTKSLVCVEAVSTTTRERRENEVEGVHYNFVTLEEFQAMDKYEETEYCGNHYGISVETIERAQHKAECVLLVVDRHGANILKEKRDDVVVFYMKTDRNTIMERMLRRGDSIDKINDRLQTTADKDEFDYDDTDYIINATQPLGEVLQDCISKIETLRI